MTRLGELARVIRSKNVGPYMVALDIVFDKKETWERVVKSGVISREKIAALYRVRPEKVTDVVEYEPGLAIKVSMIRAIPSGSFGDADVLGSQQYGPLHDLEVPD
jgi:hypothetical protein